MFEVAQIVAYEIEKRYRLIFIDSFPGYLIKVMDFARLG